MGPDERSLLLAAFDSNWIAPVGPDLGLFEREFSSVVGGMPAVALMSGSAALHLALVAMGVGPGDSVLVSTFTFAASANVIAYVGAQPVLIDSARETWNIDPELLRAELETHGIESRPLWKPMHLQPVFRDAPARLSGRLPQIPRTPGQPRFECGE